MIWKILGAGVGVAADSQYEKTLEGKLRQILKMDDQQAIKVCREIVQSEDPELDAALFRFLPVD
jgi:hypothetical protein